MEPNKNLHILQNPLLKSKVTHLRSIHSSPKEFRKLIGDIARIEAYEALADFPQEIIEVETPLTKTKQPIIREDRICLIPILRAGLGMSDGIKEMMPDAPIGLIGMYRDEQTHQAHEYYARFPKGIEDMDVLLLDPMLATGGSAIDAVSLLRKHGVKRIRFLAIIAAPEGVKAFQAKEPDIPLFVASLDDHLNEKAYIVPGLGDAGDRIFGTVD